MDIILITYLCAGFILAMIAAAVIVLTITIGERERHREHIELLRKQQEINKKLQEDIEIKKKLLFESDNVN